MHKTHIELINKLLTSTPDRVKSLKASTEGNLRNTAMKPNKRNQMKKNYEIIKEFVTDKKAFILKYQQWIRVPVDAETYTQPEDMADTLDISKLSPVQADEVVMAKRSQLKSSANSRGKEFGLTLAKIRQLLEQKRCSYTGVRFSFDPTNPRYRTIDRKDPSVGYIDSNVVAVTKQANSIKEHFFEAKHSDKKMTPKQLLMFAEKMNKIF